MGVFFQKTPKMVVLRSPPIFCHGVVLGCRMPGSPFTFTDSYPKPLTAWAQKITTGSFPNLGSNKLRFSQPANNAPNQRPKTTKSMQRTVKVDVHHGP